VVLPLFVRLLGLSGLLALIVQFMTGWNFLPAVLPIVAVFLPALVFQAFMDGVHGGDKNPDSGVVTGEAVMWHDPATLFRWLVVAVTLTGLFLVGQGWNWFSNATVALLVLAFLALLAYTFEHLTHAMSSFWVRTLVTAVVLATLFLLGYISPALDLPGAVVFVVVGFMTMAVVSSLHAQTRKLAAVDVIHDLLTPALVLLLVFGASLLPFLGWVPGWLMLVLSMVIVSLVIALVDNMMHPTPPPPTVERRRMPA
jgi:hypothetical protein